MIPVVQLLGGRGTRLSSITKGDIPKPLVKIGEFSILEHQIKHLLRFGCKDFIWICYYKIDFFEEERKRIIEKYKHLIQEIKIYKESQPLSTFGSILSAIKTTPQSEFLIIYGDILIAFDLYRFYEDFKKYPTSHTHIFTRISNHPKDSDKIQIDDRNFVSRFISKNSPFNNLDPSTTTSGIYIAKREFFTLLDSWSGQKCDLYSEVLPINGNLINATAYLSSEFILDIGTQERYKKANELAHSSSLISKSYLQPQRALLLDRDGVIIKSNGYITDTNQIIFNKNLIKLLIYLRTKDIKVGFITNQPHISQGRVNMLKHLEIKNYIIRHLAECEAIDFYYECKHYPTSGFIDEVSFYKKECYCRKPRTKLLQDCIHDHNLNIFNSLFIGDSNSDILAGETLGIKTLKYRFSEDKSENNEHEKTLDLIKNYFKKS